jgi:asparagine synthase (glutamine-hydrolysing)
MCGIAGHWAYLDPGRSPADVALLAMRDRLKHRGPDDAGIWRDPGQGLALLQRRLSIIDLSAQGHQPMASAGGRYTLVYNGEIYNHLELRARLAPKRWRGHSDTETLLALIEEQGFVGSLQHLVGMFAIACWDSEERCLWLARDRLGEKPLYWTELRSGYAFASELGALLALPETPRAVDPDALALMLRYACIPAPRTLLAGVQKLPAAHWMRLQSDKAPQVERYWDLSEIAERGQTQSAGNKWDANAALTAFDAHFERSVRGQLIADVPLGAFLSGGVDSSAVVAMMQRVSPGRVRSFCIGFDDQELSEAAHARSVAQHLGCEHTELIVSENDALELVPRLGTMFSEPFADSSQIPTYLVAQMARQQVSVALSGDAGDELFAGYNRHRLAAGRWQTLEGWPAPARAAIAGLLAAPSAQSWDRLAALLRRVMPLPSQLGDKLHKIASQVLPARNTSDLYARLTAIEPTPLQLLGKDLHASLPEVWQLEEGFAQRYGAAEAMMLADQLGYLADDILVKVDRAAMAASLETRAPFLDHRLVEFAWQLPPAARQAQGSGKWLLRQWLYRHVPQAMIDRPKQGFAVPLANWLRGPLREWAEALLEPQRLAPWFDSFAVHTLWQEHQLGQANHQQRLWSVLMVQSWREAWLPK